MSPTHAIEAVILKATPFEEHGYILSLFSREEGCISCVVKGKKGKHHSGFSPLLRVEADVVVSDKELWKCRRCEVTNSYPLIRLHLDHLRHAVAITGFLTYALPSRLPLPEIYDYFQVFLGHISSFRSSHVASVAFMAKFCLYEGVLGKEPSLSNEELKLCKQLAERAFQDSYDVICEKSVLQKLFVLASK